MNETFRLDLNQPWEAFDLRTGRPVLIPKGSRPAVRMLHRANPNDPEEPYLVVTVEHEGEKVQAGLREAYWRQWVGHHVRELQVTIQEWKYTPPLPPQKKP
jgi:hypothetical protein